jgi:hypothetical protein
LRRMLPLILEDGENELSEAFREMLVEMAERLRVFGPTHREYDLRVARAFGQDACCHRLAQVEGVGPLIATALVAVVGNAHEFKPARIRRTGGRKSERPRIERLLAWYRVSTPAVARQSCSESANAATVTCKRC